MQYRGCSYGYEAGPEISGYGFPGPSLLIQGNNYLPWEATHERTDPAPEGNLILNNDPVRCIADLDLATLKGTGRLAL
jgi:hypothetical protein